jgi:hypothetical protein
MRTGRSAWVVTLSAVCDEDGPVGRVGDGAADGSVKPQMPSRTGPDHEDAGGDLAGRGDDGGSHGDRRVGAVEARQERAAHAGDPAIRATTFA